MWLIVVLVILSVVTALLLTIVIYGAEKLAHMRKIERAVRNAWFAQGACEGDQCLVRVRPLSFPTTTSAAFDPALALKLGDYLSRIEVAGSYFKATKQEVPFQHPEDSRLLAVLPAPPPDYRPAFGAVYIVENRKIVIAMRGTSTSEEVSRDLQTNQEPFPEHETESMVHKGFLRTWKDHVNTILQILVQEQPEHVYLVGHSLGGAVATVGALELALRGYPVTCYTFGSPRIGNDGFADVLKNSEAVCWRVINECDFIKDMPPPVSPNFEDPEQPPFKYSHAGSELEFTQNNGSFKNNHVLEVYLKHMEYMATLNENSTGSERHAQPSAVTHPLDNVQSSHDIHP